jgi:hypothetical protein
MTPLADKAVMPSSSQEKAKVTSRKMNKLFTAVSAATLSISGSIDKDFIRDFLLSSQEFLKVDAR